MKDRPAWGALDLVSFACLTCALSWVAVAASAALPLGDRPMGTRLLMGSVLYALTMGWQPIAAWWIVRRVMGLEHARSEPLRTPAPSFLVLATFGPLCLALAASVVAWLASALGLIENIVPPGTLEPELTAHGPSVARALVLLLAYVLTIGVVVAQAFAEELGWREFFLGRLTEEIGAGRAIWLHGAVWGTWYAPILLLSSEDLTRSTLRIVTFVVTCALLGVLLGWLRVASDSLVPAMIANAVLTLAAGLPFVLRGVDVGVRDAVYTPAGWLPMLAVIAWLAWRGPSAARVFASRSRASG